jgi:hypothetical protein
MDANITTIFDKIVLMDAKIKTDINYCIAVTPLVPIYENKNAGKTYTNSGFSKN